MVRAVTDNLLLEINKTVDFFRSTVPSDRVDGIVLSGGTSRIEGFADALSERFDLHVEQFDPFRQIALDPAKVDSEQQIDLGPISVVAVGLALRRADDR